jgi:hypothetical protein
MDSDVNSLEADGWHGIAVGQRQSRNWQLVIGGAARQIPAGAVCTSHPPLLLPLPSPPALLLPLRSSLLTLLL